MSELRPFSIDMFEEYADLREYSYLVDRDGDYLIRLRAYDDVPAVDCWLCADDEVVTVRFYTRERFAVGDSFAVSACDAWNRTRRWPTAYTLMHAGATEIALVGRLIIDHGVSDEQLSDFIDTYIRGACCFWEELSIARRLRDAG